MNEQMKEQALDYVLDQLNDDARADFMVQMKGNIDLRQFVFEIQDSLDQSFCHAGEPPSHIVWDTISRQITDNEVSSADIALAARKRPFTLSQWISYAGWGVAALLLFVLGTFIFNQLILSQNEKPQFIVFNLSEHQFDRQIQRLPDDQLMADDRFFALADEAQKLWRKMEKSNGNVVQKAFAIIDPVQKIGFVGLYNIPEIEPDETLFLWIFDPVSKDYHSVGEIPNSSVAKAFYSFSLPEEMPLNSGFNQNYHVIITRELSDNLTEMPQGKALFGHKTLDI